MHLPQSEISFNHHRNITNARNRSSSRSGINLNFLARCDPNTGYASEGDRSDLLLRRVGEQRERGRTSIAAEIKRRWLPLVPIAPFYSISGSSPVRAVRRRQCPASSYLRLASAGSEDEIRARQVGDCIQPDRNVDPTVAIQVSVDECIPVLREGAQFACLVAECACSDEGEGLIS
jgi:hypothetical protein